MLLSKKLTILTLLLMIVPFQNCAKMSFTDMGRLSPVSRLTSSTDNNGTGYGGKLSGEFYRFNPDFTCEGKTSAQSVISAGTTSITLTENKKLFCAANTITLDPNQIDRSVYQEDIIGYREGIFEAEKSVPTSIPANLVEVWCKDTNDRSGIETITHYDRTTQVAVNRIYYAGSGSQIQTVPDFNVSRVSTATDVTIKNGSDFTLVVHRDQLASQPGLFKGNLQATIDGVSVSRETSCRLGGSLDAALWPSLQVVDMNILSFKFSPDLQSYGLTAPSGTLVPQLFTGKLGSQNLAQATPPTLKTGVPGFEFTPDSKSFVYWADQRIQNTAELFKATTSGSNPVQLNTPLSSPQMSGNFTLKFSTDGSTLFYADGHQPKFADNEMSISAVSISGGPSTILTPLLDEADVGSHDFAISRSNNKIAMLFGFTMLDLLISDLDGSNRIQPVIKAPTTGDWHIFYGTNLELPEPGNYVYVRSSRWESPYASMYSAIAIDGSEVINFPVNWIWNSTNSTGTSALIIDNTNNTSWLTEWNHFKLINLKTKSEIDIPLMAAPVFSKDGTSLLFTEKNSAGLIQQVSIDVITGRKAVLCSADASTVSKLQEIAPGIVLITSWDQKKEILNIYKYSNGSCNLQNSIPLSKPLINKVIATPDKKTAIIAVTIKKGTISHDQLFYIPLNGKAPLEIDAPVFTGAKISNIQVLPDSKTVFYTGEQFQSGENRAFVWKAP